MEEPSVPPASSQASPSPSSSPSSAGTTVADLLAVGALRLRNRSAAAVCLDRVVRWVHSTDLPDPSAYLRGGELVCTVGTVLASPELCRRFAGSVAAAGAVGICFGVGDVHDAIPDGLADACEDHDLVLLEAPHGARFSAIGEFLTSRAVAAQARGARTRDLLMPRLLAGVRRHASVTELLEDAVPVLGGRIEVHVGGELVGAAAREDAAPAGSHQPAAAVHTVRAALHDGELRWIGPRPGERALLEQLARVVDVALQNRDVEAALERERVGQLLLLVQGRLLDPSALIPLLQQAGVGDSGLVASCWPAGAAVLLTRRLAPAVVGEAPGVSVALSLSAETITATAAALDLPCGYGSAVDLHQLPQGLLQARAALDLATESGGTVGPSGLLSLEGLLGQQPPARLEPFADQLVRPLLDADNHRGTEYLLTLRAFLRHDGSLQATARERYLHVNTVRHRLTRVREITGRDPLVFEDRVALAIAVWAHDRQGPR